MLNGQDKATVARSIELATRDRLLGTVNWRGERNGRQWFTVASRSHSGVIDRVYVGTPDCGWAMEPSDGRGSHHVVSLDSASGQYHCSCPARGACGHIGAVAQYVARYLSQTAAAAAALAAMIEAAAINEHISQVTRALRGGPAVAIYRDAM